jgi:hypothetical protein
MRNIAGRIVAHRGRQVAVLTSTFAVTAATTLWLVTTSPPDASPGARGDTTVAPSSTVGAGHLAGPTSPSTTTAPRDPATAGPRELPGSGQAAAGPRPTAAPPAGGGTASPTGRVPDDLLKRQGQLPEGVPAQVEFFLGGGPDCQFSDGVGPPRIVGVADVEEIPDMLVLCFMNFDSALPLTVTLVPPVGATTSVVLPASSSFEGVFSHWYPRLSGDPVGRYRVSGHQQALDASIEFTVRRATEPRLWLDRPFDQPPGIDVHLYIGGFPPSRSASLHLYDAGSGRYRTSFAVPVDARGEAHAVIDTKPDDPPGCYGVSSPEVYDPQVPAEGAFCIFSPLS